MSYDSLESRDEAFYGASLEELKRGYKETATEVQCLICGEIYEKGEVFPKDGKYYDAAKRIQLHLKEEHGSMLHCLLQSGLTGISEIQQSVIEAMGEGLSDKEIAERQKISASTVRNHRFKLREKERQARAFLAMMELLKEMGDKMEKKTEDKLCEPHRTAAMVDDRYIITEEERKQIIQTFFDENGHLKEVPAREKRKLVVLREIADNFKPGNRYTEIEINRILKRIHNDFPYIRRLMIEYGFLERTKDGSEYWLKE